MNGNLCISHTYIHTFIHSYYMNFKCPAADLYSSILIIIIMIITINWIEWEIEFLHCRIEHHVLKISFFFRFWPNTHTHTYIHINLGQCCFHTCCVCVCVCVNPQSMYREKKNVTIFKNNVDLNDYVMVLLYEKKR